MFITRGFRTEVQVAFCVLLTGEMRKRLKRTEFKRNWLICISNGGKEELLTNLVYFETKSSF